MARKSCFDRYLRCPGRWSSRGASLDFAPMRVQIFELRLIAAGLTVAWTLAGGLVLLGYRPGGPIDLAVGLVAMGPAAISMAGLLWPPAARGYRASAAVVWLGLGAALLLVPSIGGILNQIAGRGAQTLLPSLEAGYPWLLALASTSLFSGLGIARRLLGDTALRRRRLVRGTLIGTALTVLSAGLFASAAIGNELALRDRPAIASRFGPTTAGIEPPACDERPKVGRTARVELMLSGDVDGRPVGNVQLTGVRSDIDVRWNAEVATSTMFGRFGVVRLGSQAWRLVPGGDWEPVAPATTTDSTLDLRLLLTALGSGPRAAAEGHGIEFLEGARARHCRVAVDGPTFRRALPQVAWFTGPDPLRHWRGQIDYWVFVDGQLGQITGDLNGEAGELDPDGLQATIRMELQATDRGSPVTIEAPRA